MAVSVLFAQREGGFGVALAMQQDEVGEGGEQGFDGFLPAGVGDFDEVDQQVVGDAGGVQRGAEIRRPTAAVTPPASGWPR